MTQEEKDRLQYMIDVMQAYKDGKEIELKSVGSATWTLVGWKPSWNWNAYDYRVKPEPPKPQYRPFENANEVMQAIREHGDWVKYKSTYSHLKAVFSNSISYDVVQWPFDDAFRIITFADGTSFGKLIEE